MKTKILCRLAAVVLLAGLIPKAGAIPYTDIYDFVQHGFIDDGTSHSGTLSGEISVTDVNGNGIIDSGDTIKGLWSYTILNFNPQNNGQPNFANGGSINSISGPSLLTGNFTVTGAGLVGNTSMVMTQSGTTIISYFYPVTGQFLTSTSSQAPLITMRVDDSGSSLAMLAMALLGLLGAKLFVFRRPLGLAII